VSQPHYDSFYGIDAGLGLFWRGGSQFPTGVINHPLDAADSCMYGSHSHALYTQSVLCADVNGDGKLDIITAGPCDSAESAHGGTATILLSPFDSS